MIPRRRVKAVFVGDSITAGQYVESHLRWTAVLEERLAPVSETREVDLVLLNRGVSGNTTRMALERFPDAVQQESPDMVMIQFGMNDCNCWVTDRGLPRVSERAFTANLVEMIDRCRRFGAREVVLATNPCSMRMHVLPSGEVYEEANARYSDLVRDVAADAGVLLCDVRTAFGSLSADELETMLLPAPDLLHLSPVGHAFYADVCQPAVESALDGAIAHATA